MPIAKQVDLIPIFGTGFVRDLTDPKYAVLRIGKDAWTKYEVAAIGVVQTRACAILTKIAKRLDVTNTADLYKRTSPYTFADQPAGVTTLFVMFQAFADKGLDPHAWYQKGQDDAIVSFLGLKHRELMAARRTREDEKRRKRNANNRSHRADVARVMNAGA